MTITDFSKLCGCETSTLRYYDKIGLLIPSEVDYFTGYRNYDSHQALEFIKIKNLQDAGFSISEIKSLLKQKDEEIYAAFENKIKEQEAILNKIKQIQLSYRNEMSEMIEKISKTKLDTLEEISDYEALNEFDIDELKVKSIIQDIEKTFDSELDKLKNDKNAPISVGEESYHSFLPIDETNYDIIFHVDSWKYAKEFINEIPQLEPNKTYILGFSIEDSKKKAGFLDIFLYLLMERSFTSLDNDNPINISCLAEKTSDKKNHFWLLRAK